MRPLDSFVARYETETWRDNKRCVYMQGFFLTTTDDGPLNASESLSLTVQDELRDVTRKTLERQRELNSLRREVARERARANTEVLYSLRAADAASIRAAADRRRGKGDALRLVQVAPEDPEAVAHQSSIINERLRQSCGAAPGPADWKVLFCAGLRLPHADAAPVRCSTESGADGRLFYRQFVRLLRAVLHISPAELPRPQLDALWRAIDQDALGFISRGQFCGFMRRAAGTAGARRRRLAEERHARLEERVAAYVAAEREELEHASRLLRRRTDAKLAELSSRAEALQAQAGTARDWAMSSIARGASFPLVPVPQVTALNLPPPRPRLPRAAPIAAHVRHRTVPMALSDTSPRGPAYGTSLPAGTLQRGGVAAAAATAGWGESIRQGMNAPLPPSPVPLHQISRPPLFQAAFEAAFAAAAAAG